MGPLRTEMCGAGLFIIPPKDKCPLRIGLLTGGGNMAGVNGVIRAVVKTSISHYGSEVVGVMNGFVGLMHPPMVRSLGLKDVTGFQRRGNSILGQAPRANPFELKTEDGQTDHSVEIVENYRWLGLDALIAVGGLGTIGVAKKIAKLDIPILIAPKSTTNDIPGTDYSVGYVSAIDTAVSVIDKLHSVEEKDHVVLYVSVMGKRTGSTALEAGLGGGAHVVLTPEIPYSQEEILRTIEERKQRNRPSTIIVFAAGAREVGQAEDPESSNERLNQLAADIQNKTGLNYEITRLGPIQRGGEPVSRDRSLAIAYGAALVKAAHEGFGHHLTVSKNGSIELLDLNDFEVKPRVVQPGSPLIWSSISQGISLGQDAKTLIQ